MHFLQDDIVTQGKRRTIISGRVPTIFPANFNSDEDTNLQNCHLQTGDVNSLSNRNNHDPSIEETTHSTIEINREGLTNDTVNNTEYGSTHEMQHEPRQNIHTENDSYEFLHGTNSNFSNATDKESM